MAYLREGDPIPETGKGSKLGPKMAKFVDEFMIDRNGAEAVKRAGYQTKHKNAARIAAELQNHPLVKKEIEKRMDDETKKAEIRADYLKEKLMEIIEATQTSNPTAALRAIELAGKTLALWRDRQEITGQDGEAIRLEERRIEQEIADVTSQLTRLAKRGRADNVVDINEQRSESGS